MKAKRGAHDEGAGGLQQRRHTHLLRVGIRMRGLRYPWHPRLTHDEWNHDADPTPARTRRLNDLWLNADEDGRREATILIVAYTEGRV